jgi:hypothetical protein
MATISSPTATTPVRAAPPVPPAVRVAPPVPPARFDAPFAVAFAMSTGPSSTIALMMKRPSFS